jgi:hypothetical protein
MEIDYKELLKDYINGIAEAEGICPWHIYNVDDTSPLFELIKIHAEMGCSLCKEELDIKLFPLK